MLHYLRFWLAFCLVAFLGACGGGGGSAGTPTGSANPSNFLVNAPSEVALAIGQRVSFSIAGGLSPYNVNNSAPGVVTAAIVGSNLEITPLRSGSAVVTVSPSGGGATYAITFTVSNTLTPLQVQAPDTVTLRVGGSGSYTLTGGVPPYRAVSSAPSVASVSVIGDTLQVVAGGNAGTATVEIYDSTSSSPVQRTFSVVLTSAFFTNAPSSIAMGASTSRNFTVSGGVAPYFVSSSNSSIADASLSGGNLSVVAGAANGSTNVVLRDSGGSTITLAVTVGTNATLFSNAPDSLTLQGGSSRTFTIGGGTAPYFAASGNTNIVTAAVSGSSVVLTGVNKGSTTVRLTDSAGASVNVDVTVDQSGSTLVSSIDLTTTLVSIKSAGEEATITAVVKSAGNVGVANQEVVFTSSSGTLLAPSAQTDASGIATVRLSAGSDRSNRTIVVTAVSGSITRTLNVAVVGTTLTVTGSTALQLGGSAATYTVRALDSSSNPIVGAVLTATSTLGNVLTPSSLTSNVNGNASFTYAPTVAGGDTLSVAGQGATGTLAINVSNVNFSVVTPAANTTVNVNTNQTVTVRYLSGGAPVVGQTINFTTTRGVLTPATGVATTNGSGDASIVVSSASAGPSTITAQIPAVAPSVQPVGEVTLPLTFVATVPSSVQVQINPGALPPNLTGSTNQATVEATVTDATGNPVVNKQVSFTIVTDPSNGYLTAGIALTNSTGKASTNFVSGALSTPNNGVTIRADVVGTVLSSTAKMTVNGNALFITIGFGNTITNLDPTTYSKPFSVYVTDANGVAVGNQLVTLSVIPNTYYKGSLVFGTAVWGYAVGSPTASCVNEDTNRNGILDAGEDTSGNGLLNPGNIAVASPGSVTTGADGRATFSLQYGEQFVPWANVQIVARASVSGTESRKELAFDLSGLSDDFSSETVPPAGRISPFGTSAVCTNEL